VTDHSKTVRLAGAAMHYAQAGKFEAAARYIQRISNECGGQGVEVALRAWIDTFVDHATDGDRRPKRGRMGYVNAVDGQLETDDAARIPDRIKWAGRLVEARAALDEAQYRAALDQLPEDEFEVGEYVITVLEVCADTINGLPRGFASRDARERWMNNEPIGEAGSEATPNDLDPPGES